MFLLNFFRNSGGNVRKTLPLLLVMLLLSSASLFGQAYSGPADGNIPGGVTVSTNSFNQMQPLKEPREDLIHKNKSPLKPEPFFVDGLPVIDGRDVHVEYEPQASHSTESVVLLKDFLGLTQTNSIPPDPYIAAGPNHLVATVNTDFGIYDKNGNLLKRISADSWYNSVLPGASPFDPKVLYDHYANRWIMVWLHQSDNPMKSYFLISVSDDDNPLGTWFNWAMPGDLNGTTQVSNWSDYQGVGYDDKALYITANQFGYNNTGYNYVKIRIIPKSGIYGTTPGRVDWKDLWDIRYPSNANRVFNIRPSLTWTSSGNKYHLVHVPNGGGNIFVLYTINDPIGTPTLTGTNVPVATFQAAPNANQLGGGTPLLEGGGSNLRHEPSYYDGYLHTSISIRNPLGAAYSALKYVKIDANTSTAAQDFSYGAVGYWHIYSICGVDKNGNVAVTYSRSGDNEYAGAYYSARLGTDPNGFRGTWELQSGKANYIKTFGGDRNRWGDYNGLWLDPVTKETFWMLTEYAAAVNTWGNWIGHVRVSPFAGPYLFTKTDSLHFGAVEITDAETLSVKVQNLGDAAVNISNITNANAAFKLLTQLTYPLTLAPDDSLELSVEFKPTVHAAVNDTLRFVSNSATAFGIPLRAVGYKIDAAQNRVMYAVAPVSQGTTYTLNTTSGAATSLGKTNFADIFGLAVHPKTGIIYGVRSTNPTEVVRMSGTLGDAYTLGYINTPALETCAFDTGGTFYLATRLGALYTLDLESGVVDSMFVIKTPVSSIAFHPQTNQLYASVYKALGAGRDKLVKVNITTGDTTEIGATGLTSVTDEIEFDQTGQLYGLRTNAGKSDFFKINLTTGAGTLLSTLTEGVYTAMAYQSYEPVSVRKDENGVLPSDFVLSQNYPNPFNPSTTISFSIPAAAQVKLVVYNLLGETVTTLVNQQMGAGTYQVNWNVEDASGAKLTSGIYFYELRADAGNGNQYSSMKKMVVLK